MLSILLVAIAVATPWLVSAADLSTLPQDLKAISQREYPGIEAIGQAIFSHPETATEEVFAHDTITGYFKTKKPGLFDVTPHAFGFPTAWELEFENVVNGQTGNLPTIAFLAEYDALPAIDHACGHNLIATTGLAAAVMTRQALIDFNISARVVVYGTFDEEDKAGKHQLLQAGAFQETNSVFLMAHPSIANGINPMQARLNAQLDIVDKSHFLAVERAYQELAIIRGLKGKLPGSASTASTVEDVAMYASNVVQTHIELGVTGATLQAVNDIASNVKSSNPGFAAINFTLSTDKNGVAMKVDGPGGHASQGTEGPLALATDIFSALEASNSSYGYYLPSNTSHTDMGITASLRTRYTADLDSLKSTVQSAVQAKANKITYDTAYPALEVHQDLGQHFIDLMATPEFGETWAFSTVAPAASDASFIQGAVVDPSSHALVSTKNVVVHANYNICTLPTAQCPFNHEPEFKDLANTDFAYSQTEKVARALAHTAVELANDPTFLASVRSIVKSY